MLCYRDMTFCSAPCVTVQCPRHMSHVENNRKHVEAVGLPIAQRDFRDFREGCGSFVLAGPRGDAGPAGAAGIPFSEE